MLHQHSDRLRGVQKVSLLICAAFILVTIMQTLRWITALEATKEQEDPRKAEKAKDRRKLDQVLQRKFRSGKPQSVQ